MKKLLLFLLIGLPCFARGQNTAGQIVASQFGEFKVQNEGNGFAFDPANCNISGGGKNFPAFTTGTPVKIADSNPAQTEIVIPVGASITGSYCAVSLPAQYKHTSFYLTSGTGGLQEAISNGPVKEGGPNTIILDADWYTQVAPGNPSTVIASVKGNTSLGLVDVTTAPYTAYAWNGTQYVSQGTGASIPATENPLCGTNTAGTSRACTVGTDYVEPTGSITGSAGSLSAASSLPNGTAGTTQMVGDNSTKLATDAFVIANAGAGSNPGGSNQAVQFNNASAFGGDSTFTFNNTSHTLGLLNATIQATAPAGDKSTNIANTQAVFNSMPGITAQYFGAYGDAYAPANGCYTTASSTTVTCPDGPFVPTDVGKQMWVSGAGASGHAFNATITAYTNNTTVTVSAAATSTVTQGRGIFGHDDTTAIQACIQYSSVNAVQCVLKPAPSIGAGLVGFLVGSGGLTLTSNNYLNEGSGPNIVGNSQSSGTNLFCEYNGDCLSLAAGPIQGANLSNIDIDEDATQPASRGIHLNPQAGTFGPGPFTNSNFNNVNVDNPALECLWLDGGGGPGYAYTLPNQYITFNQFFCNGPNQSHPANLIKMTGQAAQILFLNGQVNGQGWNNTSAPNYPNPMISITEKTTGLGDTPVDVKFYGYTYEVGTQGLYVGNGSNNIHFDNGYIENVSSPLIALNSPGLTFNGNHIANSGNIGAVAQFTGGTTASMRDNFVYGGVALPAAFAVCSGSGNSVDFAQNNSTVATTNQCATTQVGPNTSTLTIAGGGTQIVNGTSTPISTIVAPGIPPGKTLTLNAWSSPGFTLTTGGNISFGGITPPLVVPNGGSVTLTLFDLGPTWLVTSTTVGQPATTLSGGAVGSAPYQSAANTSAFLASPTTSGHTFVYAWQPSGSAVAPTALDFSTYLASPPPIGGTTPNSANFSSVTTTGVQTAAGFNLQSGAAGPNSNFFDDFYTGANMASDPIGSPTSDTCSPSDTYTDNNHPGNMLLTTGTAGTGTGIVCGLVSENPSIAAANTSQAWTWETAVYVPVLPGTTVGAYQAGMAHTPNVSPWTTGIGFYLSSANGVTNDWYCRYNSTSTDSGVAATVAWTRLTMVNDGTNVHWYIGGTQVCGTGVAIANMPSTTQYPAVWSATALSATSVSMAYDYINWQRAVSR